MNTHLQRRYRRLVALGAVVGMLALSTAYPAAHARAAGTVAGWPGGLTAYQGRYRLTFSSSASLATSGMLTIFGRKVPHQEYPQMSGILSLYSSDDSNVLYLTHFSTSGTHLSARVNLGIYTGPLVATFAVRSYRAGTLSATMTQIDKTTTRLTLVRFSTDPQP
jgi:hypothetical protein